MTTRWTDDGSHPTSSSVAARPEFDRHGAALTTPPPPPAPPPAPAGSPDWFADAQGVPAVDGRPPPSRIVEAAVIAVAIVAGLVAAVDGPAPTGSTGIDMVMVALAVSIVTWLGAAALRWDMGLATIVAGIASWSIVGAVVGVVVGVGGYAIPDRRGSKRVITAAMAGVALNLLCRSQLGWFFGASSVVGITLAGVIAVIGLRRRSTRTKRAVRRCAVVAAGFALVAVLGFVYSAWSAASDLRTANRRAEQALDEFAAGDIDAARASIVAADAAFHRADGALTSPAAQLARLVPVIAQHRTALAALSGAGGDASTAIAARLATLDLDSLVMTDGRIDIDGVRALESPLRAIQADLETLDASITSARNPWLVVPVTSRIDAFADEVTEQRQRGDDALAVVTAAPALLGAHGSRVYFVAFTTPAESRGLGGFMGNWAELRVDDGQIELTRFGRTDDLDRAAPPGTRFVTGPSDWLERYGSFQFTNGENGSTGAQPWHNVTMSPSMESTGRVIAELYPQSGGRELDGVLALDAYTLARLLEFTGPITLPGTSGSTDGSVLTAENAADFLLNDQYDETELDERIEVLQSFSHTVVDALLTGSLPPPEDLVDVLGPMVDQGRLAAYAVRPDEQDLLRRIGLSGTLPVLDAAASGSVRTAGAGDAIAITFNNAAGNKIDYYLASSATYSVVADATTDTASAELEVEMTNRAPIDGEPGYVIGNPVDLPIGENRTFLSVFTRLPVVELMIDGKSIDGEPGMEAGYFVTSAFVQIPAGRTVTVTFEMAGPLSLGEGYTLVARMPPSVAPTPIEVEVIYASGSDDATTTERVTASRRDPGILRVAAGVPDD